MILNLPALSLCFLLGFLRRWGETGAIVIRGKSGPTVGRLLVWNHRSIFPPHDSHIDVRNPTTGGASLSLAPAALARTPFPMKAHHAMPPAAVGGRPVPSSSSDDPRPPALLDHAAKSASGQRHPALAPPRRWVDRSVSPPRRIPLRFNDAVWSYLQNNTNTSAATARLFAELELAVTAEQDEDVVSNLTLGLSKDGRTVGDGFKVADTGRGGACGINGEAEPLAEVAAASAGYGEGQTYFFHWERNSNSV